MTLRRANRQPGALWGVAGAMSPRDGSKSARARLPRPARKAACIAPDADY